MAGKFVETRELKHHLKPSDSGHHSVPQNSRNGHSSETVQPEQEELELAILR